jgi:hypothetical protein
LLRWPIFITVLFLGFPAVHFAERWGVSSKIFEKSPSLVTLSKTFLGGALLGILLVVWDIIFVLPRDMNVLGVPALPFYTAGFW